LRPARYFDDDDDDDDDDDEAMFPVFLFLTLGFLCVL
jgi:hypothetical protein